MKDFIGATVMLLVIILLVSVQVDRNHKQTICLQKGGVFVEGRSTRDICYVGGTPVSIAGK